MSSPHPRSGQSGFTLIEVVVAIALLLVGVLGTIAMVDGANAVTSKTKAREGANSVARSIVEVGRAVPYKNLTDTDLLAALASRPGLSDTSSAPAYTIESRGFHYDVTLQVCSMDDPKDDLGLHDGTIEFCPNSDVASGVGVDRNPDDYKRIAVTLTWKRSGGNETVKQTSLVSNPVGGLGPTVILLDAPAVGGAPKTVTSSGTVRFEAETSTDASELEWSVDGAGRGAADPIAGSNRKFEFLWEIEDSGPRYYGDGTYVIQAQAFDDKGRSGSPKALTVVLNRALPRAPEPLEGVQLGGRNGSGDRVDLLWKANTERDVLGYRVYRSMIAGGPSGGPWTQVTCLGQSDSYVVDSSCLDEGAPGSDPVYYKVVAVDTEAGTGALRDGEANFLTVNTGNSVPTKPANVSACVGGSPGCTDSDGTAASDGATVIRWDASTDPDPSDSILFYRIYRDGSPVATYAHRFRIFFAGGGALAWTDPDTPDGPHTYQLTAVASNFGESALSDPVVNFP